MYLSRVQLNPARRGAQQLLASPHALHAAVLSAFPDPSPRASGRVLWRLDLGEHKAHLYVVSPERPDLTHVAEQAGWPSLPDTQTVRPYAPLLEGIADGERYSFRLTANPTHASRGDAAGRGKVYGHVTVAQQESWLLGRQERDGFAIETMPHEGAEREEKAIAVTDRRVVSFSRRETRVTLSVATFDGQLTVTDRDAFVRALSHGIGRAKGYGCGLMTVAPAR